MKAPLTVNGITLAYLSLRDWVELTQKWLAVRQQDQEAALRRMQATGTEIAQAAQDFASKRSTHGLLVDMCKTYDGALMILERSASRAGVPEDALDAALGGLDPDMVAVTAMRACGWEIKLPAEGADAGNA